MSSSMARWLLDLEVIPEDAGSLRLAWEHPLPSWLWAILLFGCAALAIWSYSRLTGRRSVRGALACIRGAILLIALVILSGPMLELPRVTIEEDWILVLADRSASMTIADAPGAGGGGAGGRLTRDQQMRDIIERHSETWARLEERSQVHWFGFHSGIFGLGRDPVADGDGAPPLPALGEADGERTNLNTALEQALQRAAARPVSGIVLFSDGRTADPPGRPIIRRLHAEAIPVHVVPLGSDEPIGDLAVGRVDAPRRAFIRDKVPVVVEIDRFGTAVRAMGGVLKLVDELTGETLDEVELMPGDERDEVTLVAQPKLAGEATWEVLIETSQPDLIPENNNRTVLVELIDRPLRVLYIEGYPRWEYRYLKNLLVREASIESSVMLLSADRDFAQEGNAPITRLPRSPEEFADYDVLVIGDAPASFFSPDQLEMIRNHVADRGAGLLWIGGERYTPNTYAGTVLADLLPMRGSLQVRAIGRPVNMVPTVLAERLNVLRLLTSDGIGWPKSLTDPSYGWSLLYYAQLIEPGRLKPTAEVLAQTTDSIDGGQLPLVTHMRYGAGQCIYVATDEIWRWRFGRGELLPDQFWVQMIRMLGRESLTTAGDRAILEVSPRRLEVNRPLRIDLRLLDAELVENRRTSIAAVLETADGRRLADIELRRLPDSEDRYGATYLPEVTGEHRVRVRDSTMAALELIMPVEVYAPENELRRPESDHDLLATLAAETGGRVLSEDDLSKLPDTELLPNRAVKTDNPLRERIWDTPLVFGLVLVLLTAEWIGRKVLRLV